MKITYQLDGIGQVKEQFDTFNYATDDAFSKFMTLVGNQAVTLLKLNTPVETGELRDSWHILEQTSDHVDVGVTSDQYDKLVYNVLGTKYQEANDFVSQVEYELQGLVDNQLHSLLQGSHDFYRNLPTIRSNKGNILKIPGLTGVHVSKSRIGRTTILRPRSGLKRTGFQKIGRRRRRGSVVGRRATTSIKREWVYKLG